MDKTDNGYFKEPVHSTTPVPRSSQDQSTATLARLWRDIKEQLLTVSDTDSAETRRLKMLIGKLYQALDEHPDFIYAMHLARTQPRGNHPWNYQRLAKDSELHLDMVSYFGDYPTPIHDFHQRAGVNIVVSGKLRMHRYARIATTVSPHYPISKLRDRGSADFDAGEAFAPVPDAGNVIQEMEAVGGRCVVLRAWLVEPVWRDCHWYFPISPQHGEEFFVQRLKRF